ncbi:hypothetical protein [Amycolatopsis sp. CA-230715]|uniref:hypothetical protein n=1 Tax=Amycolatopsis sp. CA-230715 TaxID=2745196 RepID=UPI001C02CAE2|nr:hypothetical protein [Amycolatopsis sp. CA-230715]
MDAIVGYWRHWDENGQYQELLVSPGGTGWVEYGRDGEYYEVIELTWTAQSPGRIEFRYGDGREVDASGVVHTRADMDPSSHTYEVRDDGVLVVDGPVLGAREFAPATRRV